MKQIKLKCNNCGIKFYKLLSECIRYNREKKVGLCPQCTIKSNKETNKMLQGGFQRVLKEFGI